MKRTEIKGSLVNVCGLLMLFLLQGGVVFAESSKQNTEYKVVKIEGLEPEGNSKTVMQSWDLVQQSRTPAQENLQKVIVKDNDVVFVIISQKELTRFYFDGDKIKHIYAISGELSYDMVDENLYLKPNIVKPINFFVTTEKGKTYQILAEPKDIPATQVIVIGGGNYRNSNAVMNRSTTFVPQSFKVSTYAQEGEEWLVRDSMSSDSVLMREIRKIVLAIKSNDRTLGFNIKIIDKEKREKDGLVEYVESSWSNEDIIAEKYHLANVTNENITLNKANYLAEDIIGVYLDKESLVPRESALLILLKKLR